jgi:hypothetical protein
VSEPLVKVGDPFGSWVVIAASSPAKNGQKRWQVRCKGEGGAPCGTVSIRFQADLRAGRTHRCLRCMRKARSKRAHRALRLIRAEGKIPA